MSHVAKDCVSERLRMKRRPQRSRPPGAGRSRNTKVPDSVGVMTIDRIAAGGDGVGRLNGLAVFVPRTAPGDVVQIAYGVHARHGRGRVLQLLETSPSRVEPPCRHYEHDRCGGCQLQHLDEATQRQARQEIVQDTLRRIGRREIGLPSLVSDVQWGYRGRLTLTLQRRGPGWMGGLHPHDDPTRVFALEECRIAHPTLVEVWQSLRGPLRINAPALPEAPALRLALRLDDVAPSNAEPRRTVSLIVQGGNEWPERSAWSDVVHEADGRISQVLWTPDEQTARVESGSEIAAPAAQEALAFAQVNASVAAALQSFVFDEVMALRPRRVVDAYAGTGRLSAALAAAGVQVTAIEADAAGAESANARLQSLAPAAAARARVVCDLVEAALVSAELSAELPDVVVLNPPRRGVDAAVTRWLEDAANSALRAVVYVSCDPGTLARDLSRLPSWTVATVQCYDMFPQTAHVETVCILRREKA